MEQPSKQQARFAYGAAVAFSLAAIIEGVVALTRGPGWQVWSAVGLGGAAVLWWVAVLTRYRGA